MASSKETSNIDKEPHLRNISYSSFINPTSDASLTKIIEKGKIPNSIITTEKENIYNGKKKVENGEISVFGAERYFNGEIDEETVDQHCLKTQKLHLSPSKMMTQTRSQSVHSQSSWNSRSQSVHSQSSWNSQRALLQSGRKSPIHHINAKWRQGKSFLLTLTCSCCDKKSADIEENKSGIFTKRIREEVDLDHTIKALMNPCVVEMQMKKNQDLKADIKKEDCFTFPIMNLKPDNFERKPIIQEHKEEKKINPLEVFVSPTVTKRKESLVKKLDLVPSNINSKREEIDYPPSSNEIFNGFDSDSSSDLFEIKSFSTTNDSTPYLLRQASSVSSCVTPRYAPSEASIEWSIATASAADFSTISDSDYQKSSFKASDTTRTGKEEEGQKRRLGILSGCKSQKAITVAQGAHRVHRKVVSGLRGEHIL